MEYSNDKHTRRGDDRKSRRHRSSSHSSENDTVEVCKLNSFCIKLTMLHVYFLH